MQAIAARSGIKGELDNAVKRANEAQGKIDNLKMDVDEAHKERDRY